MTYNQLLSELQSARYGWLLTRRQMETIADAARAERNPKRKAELWRQHKTLSENLENYNYRGERAKEKIEQWERTTRYRSDTL